MTGPARIALCALALLAVPVAACTTGGPNRGRDAGPGGGTDAWAPVDPACNPTQDADGDGIADTREGTNDPDGDGLPSFQDPDSDGDGASDSDEAATGNPCAPRNSDSDPLPDFLDTDSDNDGLTDQDERGRGTDPLDRDSDDDGVTDLGEVLGTGTDPLDRTSTIPEEDFFVVLPYLGERVPRELEFGTDITVADVYFLVDTTGSMGGPISNVQSSLTRIAAELSTRIDSVQMGVGEHKDFPFCDGDPFGSECFGDASDDAYVHHQDITDDVARVQAGLARLTASGGADTPESQVEALYQTASGLGGSWTYGGGGSWSLPRKVCEVLPDETRRRIGYPCFRPGALPIVVLVSDVPWHNGATGGEPYANISPAPHTFAQAVSEMNRIGARYIGVAVDGGGRFEHEEMARATGSVDAGGRPLVYDAAGGSVSDAIIEGISTLVGGTPQDVDTRTQNVAGNPGDVDATGFIKAITPNRGCSPATGACGPNPGVTYASQDDRTFYEVIPGVRVYFDVDFYNDFVPPPPTAQIFRAQIIVVGNGVTDLDEREVYIIVPPEGGEILL
ncbi:MAG: hypothetical protein OHK0013_24700 [Sandaracinaceae bacterium]